MSGNLQPTEQPTETRLLVVDAEFRHGLVESLQGVAVTSVGMCLIALVAKRHDSRQVGGRERGVGKSRVDLLDVLGTVVSVRSGRGMGPVKRISHVEARPHKVLSFCW